MRGLLWLLTLFALAVGLSLAANFSDGYLLVVSPPYRVELSLSLAFLLLLIGFALVYAVLRTIDLTQSLPGRVRGFRERRLREKSEHNIHEATRLLFEGRYSQALKKAAAAHESGLSRALPALLAARSAQRLQDYPVQQEWLDRAVQTDPAMQSACRMLEAEMRLEKREYAGAVVALEQFHDGAGLHVAALLLELRAKQGLGDHEEVVRLARLLAKHGALPPDAARTIIADAHCAIIHHWADHLERLKAYLHDVPEREKDARLIGEYAEVLVALGEFDEAQRLIERQLDKVWDVSLVGLYGRDSGMDLASRTAQAEKWLLDHAEDEHLLLALGRMSIVQGLWEKAQTYLDASLSLVDRSEVRLEIARLCELTDRPGEALQHYRAAAEQLK